MNTLKLWMMLPIALLSLCAVSCNGDDDEGGINRNDLVGVWEKYYEAKYDSLGNLQKERTITDSGTYEFQSDGTFIWKSKDGQNGEGSSWKLTGNELVLYGDEHYRILSLNSEELVLTYTSYDWYYDMRFLGKYVEKYRRIKE